MKHPIHRAIGVIATFWILILLLGCSGETTTSTSPKLIHDQGEVASIYTVNYPLQYLAERIVGETAKVSFPMESGSDPAYWLPSSETILGYQQADLILLNGANYAKWVQTATLPSAKLVNTSQAFQSELINDANLISHSHGDEGEHSHEGLAFTLWIDPVLAAKQAKAIAGAVEQLASIDPNSVKKNLTQLTKDLGTLDKALRLALEALSETHIIWSHPVFQYLEAKGNLSATALHWEPDQEPSEAQWEFLSALVKKEKKALMIWEGAPLESTQQKLTQMGLKWMVFDPCATRPDEGDFVTTMRANINELKQRSSEVK